MFNGDKSKARTPSTRVDTLIGPQVTIKGDVTFSGGLYLEGRVLGTLIAQGNDAVLTIAESGYIEGEARAPVIVINGELKGDVHAGERMELLDRARVSGNVHYKVVEMAAGATISGRLIHSDAVLADITNTGVSKADVKAKTEAFIARAATGA